MTPTRRILLWAWTTVLLGSLLWPLAAPGELLLRDMSVVDHPALSLNTLGFGDLPSKVSLPVWKSSVGVGLGLMFGFTVICKEIL